MVIHACPRTWATCLWNSALVIWKLHMFRDTLTSYFSRQNKKQTVIWNIFLLSTWGKCAQAFKFLCSVFFFLHTKKRVFQHKCFEYKKGLIFLLQWILQKKHDYSVFLKANQKNHTLLLTLMILQQFHNYRVLQFDSNKAQFHCPSPIWGHVCSCMP